MIAKRYLPVGLIAARKSSLYLSALILIALLFLPPWILQGEGKVTKSKTSGKKQTTSTANTLRIKDISFRIEDGKEEFMVTLNRSYKPKTRYINGANTHVVMEFYPVADFEEQDYSKIIADTKYIKQLRSYYDKATKKFRFVLDLNGASNYSIAPVNGGPGNIFTLEITESKSVKAEIQEEESEIPSSTGLPDDAD